MNIFYYDIAIPIPIRETFTYQSKEILKSGSRVAVKFRNKDMVGYVVKQLDNKPDFSTTKISEILDSEPIFKSSDMQIILWLADYYHHPIGEVFDTFCPPALRKITKTNTLLAIEEPIYIASSEDKVFELNKEQLNCVKEIKNLKGFDPCLLYGVTGSGKTEIYLQIADFYLSQGHSILILVPEISLTPQLQERFINRFGDNIGIYHSRQTPKQRYDVWQKARNGEIKIVIGTRSAVLCPLNN